MVNVKLLSQRLTDSTLSIHLEKNKDVEIKIGYSFSVNYMEDNLHAKAYLEQRAFSDDSQQLMLKVLVEGFFVCDGILTDEDKKIAHVQMYNYLFPHVQSLIAHLSVYSGLPAVIIPSDNIAVETVQLK